MAQSSKRSSKTLPSRTSTFAKGSQSCEAKKVLVPAPVPLSKSGCREKKHIQGAPVYARMQSLVQRMLHSERGVPIKSHKRRVLSAIPSAFTGADVVNWLTRNLSIQSKAEAIHLANLLCNHGFFFCVENTTTPVRDDNSLFRFQTPYYWPSQDPDVCEFEYGTYLVKQVLRSKHRIRLLDYELKTLHKLKLRLAKDWKAITENAEDDIKVFREQKRVAREIMCSQEEAFWRIHKPRPGESGAQDSALTRHGTQRMDYSLSAAMMIEALTEERDLLRRMLKRPRCKLSTSIDRMANYVKTYAEFDPMITPPEPSNPWVTGDTTLWDLEKSLVEFPSERRVKKWTCSLYDLLHDVTGRFKFENYCKSQYNLENVKFWQACKDLQTIPLHAVHGSVQLIYDEFLQRNAPSEVNVSANVMEEVEKDLRRPSRYSFTSAKEQIFKLMENDIYPRFLKSEEYQRLLRKGKESKSAGKGFFAKLQKKKFEGVRQDATEISPCLPHRFARSHLSITHRSSLTGGGSSSLDDIYKACGEGNSRFLGTRMETKRNSECTEAFIVSLCAPTPDKVMTDEARSRRVSAPEEVTPILTTTDLEPPDKEEMEEIQEASLVLPNFSGDMQVMKPMSFSADNLQQLMENTNTGLPNKWKLFGMNAGINLTDSVVNSKQPRASGGAGPSRRNTSQDTNQNRLTPRLMLTSPKHGFYEFDSFSTEQTLGRNELTVSRGSLQSTSSH